jgi:drug/metabolite transporter (DMT)-like permease
MPPPPHPKPHTPPPPPHKPLPPDEKPISPPLDSLPHHKPPKTRKVKPLISAAILGTLVTLIVGLVLQYFNISIEVILMALTPIWVGSITLFYSVRTKH